MNAVSNFSAYFDTLKCFRDSYVVNKTNFTNWINFLTNFQDEKRKISSRENDLKITYFHTLNFLFLNTCISVSNVLNFDLSFMRPLNNCKSIMDWLYAKKLCTYIFLMTHAASSYIFRELLDLYEWGIEQQIFEMVG